ncbi:hypothetical protein Golob_025172 [Gossypium lobatum]|uniref:Uncharacterized protein n=1 Tax=Gossypium lobatum TaxID=34289 RepID=A0A7J8ND79_9ROSI|nr:hypothetical protein [Gossypium lobatum]
MSASMAKQFGDFRGKFIEYEGSAQIQGVGKTIKGRGGCIDALNANGLIYGAMELVSDEENDPIKLSDDKK